MTLPDLATQSLYLDIGWSIVVSAVIVALLAAARAVRVVGVARVAIICSAVFACMSLPGAASPSFWLGLAFQHPSLVLVGLCALHIARAAGHWADEPGGSILPWGPGATLTALGLVLYAGTFLWLPYDVYQYGYWDFAAASATTVLVAFWWAVWPSSRAVCLLVAAAALVHALTRLPSGNAWDALLDPLLFAWAATATIVALVPTTKSIVARLRRVVASRRTASSPGGAHSHR